MCTSVCVCTCFPERKHLLQSVRGHLSGPAARRPQDPTPRPEDVAEQLPQRTVAQPPPDTQPGSPNESLACETGMPQEISSGSHTSAQFMTPQRGLATKTLRKVTKCRFTAKLFNNENSQLCSRKYAPDQKGAVFCIFVHSLGKLYRFTSVY